MNILIIGSGGREHALAWKISKSPLAQKVYCAPGNAGIASVAECVPIPVSDFAALADFAESHDIGLTVVGPDDPLVGGIVDVFEDRGLRVFGPDKKAAILEGSKAFTKNLLKKYNIPTAAYEVFADAVTAVGYLAEVRFPVVIKADGLALGKGVLICRDYNQAVDAIDLIMVQKKFGASGGKLVIEEYLCGTEVSTFCLCDGEHMVFLGSAKDHKKIGDGDTGENTGGMGTISPAPAYSDEVHAFCMEQIYKPTFEAMKEEGRPFKGVIFAGLMLTNEGPKVLEYNARFGDPETQVLLPRLQNDLVEVLNACIDGHADTLNLQLADTNTACVIAASGGYPADYAKGYQISGLDTLENDDGTVVFHSGTAVADDGRIMTAGGRVLGVVSMGDTLEAALANAYTGIDKIHFTDIYFRHDIGKSR